ncbi:MAG: hypothetical protein OHK0046_40470 [Anaerolineae bacterium]
MFGIVSILDHEHEARVKALWQEFREKFNMAGFAERPIPHFSYHVADGYDVQQLKPILARIAEQTDVFEVMTNGLALFTGAKPVLYIPVRLNTPLRALHQTIWEALPSGIATAPNLYYQAEGWVPHITLAADDMGHAHLPAVIQLLSPRDFRWRIRVDNVALLSSEQGEIERVKLRMSFLD